jgi:hypothetical protein
MKPVRGVFKKEKATYKVKDLIFAAIITGILVYCSHI